MRSTDLRLRLFGGGTYLLLQRIGLLGDLLHFRSSIWIDAGPRFQLGQLRGLLFQLLLQPREILWRNRRFAFAARRACRSGTRWRGIATGITGRSGIGRRSHPRFFQRGDPLGLLFQHGLYIRGNCRFPGLGRTASATTCRAVSSAAVTASALIASASMAGSCSGNQPAGRCGSAQIVAAAPRPAATTPPKATGQKPVLRTVTFCCDAAGCFVAACGVPAVSASGLLRESIEGTPGFTSSFGASFGPVSGSVAADVTAALPISACFGVGLGSAAARPVADFPTSAESAASIFPPRAAAESPLPAPVSVVAITPGSAASFLSFSVSFGCSAEEAAGLFEGLLLLGFVTFTPRHRAPRWHRGRRVFRLSLLTRGCSLNPL
ncbi:hypothetical protein [Paracoccus methylarcula]|uniref:Uncharacterized protein n=1 Tax=Paracoccus methylarcula TaxID=72022 RepID=A0A3R7LQA1_9RHOB|nr:hypothetical protein [Paracoccus methylarcula]RNF35127.1 hypothetical protein A7A09_005590 [Paracoccus methylarcula]